MAVLGRLLVSSAERLDLPDLLSLDSYAAGDWKYFLKGLVGDTKPFILKGFDVIDPTNAIGTQSCAIRVADSVTFFPGSNAGSFFHGLQDGHPQAVPLVPELRKNAVNYVYLTFTTFNTSVDTRAFWDPDKDGGAGGEFTQDINTESVLQVQVNVSTGSFPANTIPVAKITVGPVVITAIEDARDLMFRLGNGGINPNPFNTYAWRSLPNSGYARQEPPTQMQAGGVNPFQGADKNILTLKEWMDAIMSKLRELGGTTYWYDDTSSFSIITNFYDAIATAFKSKGKWVHDTTTPGLLTWTEDIQIKMTSDPRTYIIRQGSEQLQNEQVMYLAMQRNLLFNPTDENVSWTNGQPYINTIGGAVGLFANLSKGDYVKKAADTIDKWVRVEEFYDAVNLGGSTTTAAGARSVRLSSAYLGGTGNEKGRYDKGVYTVADVTVSDRDDAAIANTGGNFHWLALRSDTIEGVGSIATTNITVAIDQHDGSTARVTSTAHGLVDGDRVTITGTTNFDDTYQVEVESANVFYITVSGGPFADETGAGHYATVTTVARLTPYGFQEESANHGFNSNDTIQIDGTTNYDGSYKVNVLSPTTFNIAVPAPAATETTGTATLAKIIVRTEGAVEQIIQGQTIDIGGSVADNIRQYVGMDSLSQTAPNYSIPPSYNTLDGMQNYNGVVGDNLTVRVAKLTAMMADKAQDKTILALPQGITSVNNTTNGAAQEITFTPPGGSLTFITPGSDGQAFVALPGTAPGISLLANQAAYVSIDRNAPSTPSIVIAAIEDVPVDENVFLVAVRLSTTEIYLWEGTVITGGGAPGPGQLPLIVAQNQALKLVAGGIWDWDGTNLSWDDTATMQVPGLANTVNSIAAGTVALTTGQVAYVDINRIAPGGALTVNVATNATMTMTADRFIIAREDGGDVIVGNHSMRLVTGESKALYAGSSDQTLTFIGSTGEADDAPNYSSNIIVTDGQSLVDAISALDNAAGGGAANANQDRMMKLTKGGIWSWSSGTGSLTWGASAFIQIAGLLDVRNEITSNTVNLPADGSVAYVTVNRSGATPATLTVTVANIASVPVTDSVVIIARRAGTNVIVGNHSMLLVNGESKALYAGMSDQNSTFIGSTGEADAAPAYTSNIRGTAVQSLLARASVNTDSIGDEQEDRSAYFRSDSPVTWTGTQLLFTDPIILEILNTKTGVTKTATIAAINSPLSLADGQNAYITIDRLLATETLVPTISSSLPAQVQATKDIIILGHRKDVLGTGYLHLPLHKQVLEAGQTVRLGASGSGSGSGSGTGDDLGTLLFRASFNDAFSEGPTDAKSAVNTTAGFTDSTAYSAAKAMYTLNYDAGGTIAVGTTTTNVVISPAPLFTVKTGDMVINNGQARKITAVISQTNFTTEAFTVAPVLASQVTTSQAVHTKDVYNFAVDGNALSAAFSGATFQEILLDYEDTTLTGDNIFDVNTVPVIAYSASQDGTSFTDNKTRVTLETDQMQSVMLPAAGTGLYMRFFANKTAGSGIVNLLGYRSFMQKLVAATAGGITNSAYAFTNGIGTPINTTVSVVGGKTTLALSWQYATGVLPGTTASSIEVWLNGSKLPRFVNSTLTPDGSFLETSSSVITLDRDYSMLNLSVEVFQRTQIVDSSTQNTSNLSYLQEIAGVGSQAFVNMPMMTATPGTGTPASGTFHSSIIGRAPMLDLSRDLKVRMGVTRMATHSLQIILNETGTIGEKVFGLTNDPFGQVRFVGSWSQALGGGGGAQSQAFTIVGDFMEVTFYGTGLNILTNVNTTAFDVRVSVDGGPEGANIMPNANPLQNGRLYNSNVVVPAATGLALGVHTVRARNAGTNGWNVQSIEIVNNSTALQVNPGVSYSRGQKLTLPAAVTPAYNSTFDAGTLGTRGGRVIVYQKADGTIGKSVTPAGSQLNLNAADHTNEEMVRNINYREFGAGRSDDFANLAGGSPLNKAFTLDDNTTTLNGAGVATGNSTGQYPEGMYAVNIGGYFVFTFVGTGCDIVQTQQNTGTTDIYSVQVDGVSIGNLDNLNFVAGRTITKRIVSGLPYGTHTVRITRTAGPTAGPGFSSFITYQPKKPVIPTGATELADYNIMANYVTPAGTQNQDKVSPGVLRKHALRELTFGGTWSIQAQDLDAGGFNIQSTTNGSTITYYFYGTGFELGLRGGAGSPSMTIAIDGALYTGAATALIGTSGNTITSWTPGTSTYVAESGLGARLCVSGLALGWHTVLVTGTAFANTAVFNTFDIITPIHNAKFNSTYVAQGALTVGSQGVGDLRKWTPVKDVPAQSKNVSVATGVTSNPTNGSVDFIPLIDMSTVHVNASGKIRITYSGRMANNTNGAGTVLAMMVDGMFVGQAKVYTTTADNTITDVWVASVSPGSHHVQMMWYPGAGVATAIGGTRSLTVEDA